MSKDVELSEKILDLIRNTTPKDVKHLIDVADRELDISRDIIIKNILELENQGKIKFSPPSEIISKNFSSYLFSKYAIWFWLIIIISMASIYSVFTIPEKSIPYVYIRYILGFIFVLLLPGFSLVKILFPKKEIDIIERIALSIGISLALVPLVGLILNFSPWGIRLTPISLSLFTLIIILAIVGLLREYIEKTEY